MYESTGCGTQDVAAAGNHGNHGVLMQAWGHAGGREQHQKQQQEHQQYEHHRHNQRRHAPQILESSPPPTDTPSPEAGGRSSPTQTVEKLARRLSRQNLQLGQQSYAPVQTPESTSSLPNVLQIPKSREWTEPEAYTQPQQAFAHRPVYSRIAPWLLSVPDMNEPIEVDEAFAGEPSEDRPDSKRFRPWESAHLQGGYINSRPVDLSIQSMIATETTCSVRDEAPLVPTISPPSTSSELATRPEAASHLPVIEPELQYAMPRCDLEPDDAGDEEMGDVLKEELSPVESGILRAARGPGRIRKYTVDGVSLRYRLAVDAALRCGTVVRSRPRMRKRHKTRHGSVPSPAAVSAAPSPAISALPSALPQPHPSPPP